MTLDEAWRILQENQFKRTKNRETILQFFSNNDRYLTAVDVKNFMEADNPGISFDTIYRNLINIFRTWHSRRNRFKRRTSFSNAM